MASYSTIDDRSATAPVRVPGITVYFWIVKILTTAVGEASSDFLGQHGAALAAIVGAVGLAIALIIQFRMHRYVAWAYWFAVVMVAIFGTMLADVLHSGLKIPYTVSAIALLVILIGIFAWWHRSEGTLSIHSITTRRRESFYWGAVMATFALGTAVGDLTATNFGWGYLLSGLIFTAAIIIVAIIYAAIARNSASARREASTASVACFWIAYIITRPLGASYADWMGEPPEKGGIGWGDGNVAIALFVLIILVVAYLSISKRDLQPAHATGAPEPA